MQKFPFLSREFLNKRHRLSHQQIDELLNEEYSKENITEKQGQLFQVGEFITLTNAFDEAAIPYTPLKGPILSYRLHKDSTYRYSNDLDFLIPTNAIKKTIVVLDKSGYQPYYFPWPTTATNERRLLKFSNQLLFFHPVKQINIELHWRLFAFDITNPIVVEKVINTNGTKILFNDRNFITFNNELELLYLVIHGGLHAWFRLKWLVDVKDFIEKIPFNSEKFSQLVIKFNASRLVLLCNDALTNYFPDCPLLPNKQPLNTDKLSKFTISQIEDDELYHQKSITGRIKFYWFLLYCFPGLRYKRSVLAVIFYSKYLSIFEFHRSSK